MLCCRGGTFIRSGDTLLAFGNNTYRLISTDHGIQVTTPTLLDLPGPAVKIIVDWENIFVRLEDGAWVGRGRYYSNHFIPVPEADLIGGFSLPGWTPVKDDYAEKLNAQEAADNVMFLPEPIANA